MMDQCDELMESCGMIPKRIVQQAGCRKRREWKALKRQQFKAVQKAIDEFRLDCEYCPGFNDQIIHLISRAEDVEDSLSIKRWGR